ncbi:MAG: hypothetical protein AB1414_16655 [bacterium]
MYKKVMLSGLMVGLVFVTVSVYGRGVLPLSGKVWESDSISYHAPCWGEDNKIYFIKCVTFAKVTEKPSMVTGGNYFVYDVKYFLCTMNYDGTEKKEITELLGKKARRAYKKEYRRYLEITSLSDTYLDYCITTKKLVYNIGDKSGIWTIEIDGINEKCISPDGTHPSWSPDGNRIVYRIQIVKGERGKDGFFKGPLEYYDSLWVMDANGSNKNKIFTEEVDIWVTSPIWSPKGDLIAFVCKGWIWVMKPDGSERRKVIKGSNVVSWFPDGKSLFVSSCRGWGKVDLEGNFITRFEKYGYLSQDGRRMVGMGFKSIDVLTGDEIYLFDDIKHPKHFVYKRPDNIW